jgi:hypothetical protein
MHRNSYIRVLYNIVKFEIDFVPDHIIYDRQYLIFIIRIEYRIIIIKISLQITLE